MFTRRTRLGLLVTLLALVAMAALACETKEVIKEVPVEKIVTQEVIKEVPVERIVTQEVIKEVQVPGETVVVEKEVIKIVEVDKPVEVIKEVVKIVEVDKFVEVEKVVTVEVPVEVALTVTTFRESPAMAELVAANLLPPVEERLPKDPRVLVPLDRVGIHGGTLRRMHFSSGDHWNMGYLNFEGLTRFNAEGSGLLPSIAKSWAPSEGNKVWTFKIRDGLKWSDGAPFTMDDFMFEHLDVQLNTDLMASPPSKLFAGGEFVKFEPVDDTTIRFRFASANPGWPVVVAQLNRPRGLEQELFSPKHYLKQFHIKYNDKANELAVKEGYADWTELFAARDDIVMTPDRPTMRPWALKTRLVDQQMIAERNPYYYYVDPEGNQLPYIDRVVWTLTPDPEVRILEFLAGNTDFQGRGLSLSNYPLAKENEAKGDYRIIFGRGLGGTESIKVNNSLEGPLGDLLREIDFKAALSVAIDRNSLNEILYLGLGQARGIVPLESHPYYPGDKWRDLYVDYNPTRANALLDGLGLTARDGDGFRLDREGNTINIVWKGDVSDTEEIIKSNWEEIGIKTTLRQVERTVLYTETANNSYEIHRGGFSTTHFLFSDPAYTSAVQADWLSNMGPGWAKWHESDGAEGIEPPDEMKRLVQLHIRGAQAPPAEAVELAQEAFRNITENLWAIPLVGLAPGVILVKNYVVNAPAEVTYGSFPTRSIAVTQPEQFWFDKACRRAGELDC